MPLRIIQNSKLNFSLFSFAQMYGLFCTGIVYSGFHYNTELLTVYIRSCNKSDNAHLFWLEEAQHDLVLSSPVLGLVYTLVLTFVQFCMHVYMHFLAFYFNSLHSCVFTCIPAWIKMQHTVLVNKMLMKVLQWCKLGSLKCIHFSSLMEASCTQQGWGLQLM